METITVNETEFHQHPIHTAYYANENGEIYSTKTRKCLKGGLKNGYRSITIIINGKNHYFLVHRLVYECFNGIIPEGFEIDHINHQRNDNRIENLRLVSKSENQKNVTYRRGVQYDYVDELPPNSLRIERYKDREIDDLYYCRETDQFFVPVHGNFRILFVDDTRNRIRHGGHDLSTLIIKQQLE